MFSKIARHASLLIFLVSGMVRGGTFTVNSLEDSHDISPGDFVCLDSEIPDSGRCTLRAALEEANARPGPDTIVVPYDTLAVRLELGLRVTQAIYI